ncbi:MAG: hypothetical protein ACJ8ER_13840 [Allosphingosinicella sp.]
MAAIARPIALLALFAAVLAQPAAAQQQIETGGAYVHGPAHAVYPLRVGDFRRADIYQYDSAGEDVSASYNLATPEGRLLITVYIYPAPAVSSPGSGAAEARAQACDQEFENVKAAISTQHDQAAPIEQGEALAVPGVKAGLSHRSVYRFRTPFDDRVQEIRSEAHLYCYVGGDWLVKYRVSAPAAVETRGPVESFIRNGPWPGRNAADTVLRPAPADSAPG